MSMLRIMAGHKLHCWGKKRTGEFGNGVATPSVSPVVSGGGMKGRAFCWGSGLGV